MAPRPLPKFQPNLAIPPGHPHLCHWRLCPHCAVHLAQVQLNVKHPMAMRLTKLASGGKNLVPACLIAAQCALIWATSCASVSTATSGRISAAICNFCGAQVLVCSICRAAVMLHATLCEALVLPSVWCYTETCACHPSVHQQLSRIHAQEFVPVSRFSQRSALARQL